MRKKQKRQITGIAVILLVAILIVVGLKFGGILSVISPRESGKEATMLFYIQSIYQYHNDYPQSTFSYMIGDYKLQLETTRTQYGNYKYLKAWKNNIQVFDANCAPGCLSKGPWIIDNRLQASIYSISMTASTSGREEFLAVKVLDPKFLSEIKDNPSMVFRSQEYSYTHDLTFEEVPIPLKIIPQPFVETETLVGTAKGEFNGTTVNVNKATQLKVFIPTSKVTEFATITPRATFSFNPSLVTPSTGFVACGDKKLPSSCASDVWISSPLDTSKWKNCDGDIPVTLDKCFSKDIATFTEDSFKIQVIPEPLVMRQACDKGVTCLAGYTCKDLGNGEFGCLRQDVLDLKLGCQILGCPSVNNSLYQCSSSGLCVETVFQVQDCRQLGCREGATCQDDGTCLSIINQTIREVYTPKCGVDYQCGTGLSCVQTESGFEYCIRKEYVKELVQCEDSSDCQVPCPGITVGCEDSFCDYSGSCTTIEVGCKQGLSCAEGSYCDKESNVCREIKKTPWLVYGLIAFGIIVVFGILFLAYKKTKR